MHVPQTPEFSTIRRFPGVEVDAPPITAASLRVLTEAMLVLLEGTPPGTPSSTGTCPALVNMRNAIIVRSTGWKSIFGEKRCQNHTGKIKAFPSSTCFIPKLQKPSSATNGGKGYPKFRYSVLQIDCCKWYRRGDDAAESGPPCRPHSPP
jgi:hypothetical protein